MTFSLGNLGGAPVWAGRAVGGSTVINSGTCYRTPERVFRDWREELGLAAFSSETLGPYYERVESMLRVAPAKRELLGGVGRVVARGAEALRLSHQPLVRNAPDCDGQGVCCFGCPTGAKRSTDVSYVPEALLRGAQLVTAAHVDVVEVVAGRARGVRGTLGSGKRFRVRADAVVVAGGALMTPLLLGRGTRCSARTSRFTPPRRSWRCSTRTSTCRAASRRATRSTRTPRRACASRARPRRWT
jgi:choline dehydrogenase-like flavoprotein